MRAGPSASLDRGGRLTDRCGEVNRRAKRQEHKKQNYNVQNELLDVRSPQLLSTGVVTKFHLG